MRQGRSTVALIYASNRRSKKSLPSDISPPPSSNRLFVVPFTCFDCSFVKLFLRVGIVLQNTTSSEREGLEVRRENNRKVEERNAKTKLGINSSFGRRKTNFFIQFIPSLVPGVPSATSWEIENRKHNGDTPSRQ